MYIKVTHGATMGGDFLIEVVGPIISGVAALPFDPKAQDHDIGGELSREIRRQMGLPSDGDEFVSIFNRVHVLEIDQDQTQYEANKGLIAVRYAYWEEPNDGLHAVVTTRNIFILSDAGKTIDRVR